MTPEEMLDLADKLIDGSINAEEALRLEAAISDSAQLRSQYVAYLYQNAGIGRAAAGGPLKISPALPEIETGNNPSPAAPTPVASWGGWPGRLVAAAVTLAIGVGVGSALRGGSDADPTVIATLTRTSNCVWQASELPTTVGAKLSPGNMKLLSGLAEFRFESGVILSIESPAELELISPMRCQLHSGTAVAQVPDGAEGFVIDTQAAEMTDLGTEFGVRVQPDGVTKVQVFDGEVDVRQKDTGTVQRLSADDESSLEMGQDASQSLPVFAEDGQRVITVNTSTGNGADAYIQASDPEVHGSKTLILVKNSLPFDGKKHYSRKGYMRFDLSELAGQSVQRVRLELENQYSGWGFAALVPDARFRVYGLKRGVWDDWTEGQIDWENAPANDPASGSELLEDRVVPLGEFLVPQGVSSGVSLLETPELTEFIAAGGEQEVTLIITRVTKELQAGGLVHAFASRRHPSATAPTLRIAVAAE
ncbi:MAG: DNRLRE domain-containing protein [Pirellulales bacterium]|nr:DNRLRE domain-containing protein [Pirellulales bacterium]